MQNIRILFIVYIYLIFLFFFFFFYGFFLFFFLDIYNISLLSEYQPGTTVSRPSRTPRTPGLSDSRTSWLFGPDCFLVLQTQNQPINASAQLEQLGPNFCSQVHTSTPQPVPHLPWMPFIDINDE